MDSIPPQLDFKRRTGSPRWILRRATFYLTGADTTSPATLPTTYVAASAPRPTPDVRPGRYGWWSGRNCRGGQWTVRRRPPAFPATPSGGGGTPPVPGYVQVPRVTPARERARAAVRVQLVEPMWQAKLGGCAGQGTRGSGVRGLVLGPRSSALRRTGTTAAAPRSWGARARRHREDHGPPSGRIELRGPRPEAGEGRGRRAEAILVGIFTSGCVAVRKPRGPRSPPDPTEGAVTTPAARVPTQGAPYLLSRDAAARPLEERDRRGLESAWNRGRGVAGPASMPNLPVRAPTGAALERPTPLSRNREDEHGA